MRLAFLVYMGYFKSGESGGCYFLIGRTVLLWKKHYSKILCQSVLKFDTEQRQTAKHLPDFGCCGFFGLFGRVLKVVLPNVSPVSVAGIFRGLKAFANTFARFGTDLKPGVKISVMKSYNVLFWLPPFLELSYRILICSANTGSLLHSCGSIILVEVWGRDCY